jgi:nucleoid-associated protein YgaU
MRRRRSMAVAGVAVAALLVVGCEPLDKRSRTTTDTDESKDGVRLRSVTKVYVVQEGDTLYSIAIEQCGSGAAVETLTEVNVGRRQPDGRVMKNPDMLRPGWELVLSCQTVSD